MSGQRKALIIANDEYEQEALRNLLAPAADAEALGRVLGDPQIGDFVVQVVRNEPAHVIQGQIEEMLSESRPDDVLLLHFSGHGMKNESGELFFAAANTRPNRLGSTAVPADFVQRCMRDSRSRIVVLLLDCCFGGAFAQGVTVRAAGDVNVLDSFPQGRSGGGRGRAVITASNAMEYAFEGDQLGDNQHRRPSVFTSALVEGLATGDADRDEDGLVSLDELYDYVFDKVREQNPHQTPSRQVDLQGELYLARSRRRRIRPAPIPADLKNALADPNMYTRLGAVTELRSRLASDHLPTAVGAYEALAELARTGIRYVADPAAEAITGAAIQPAQTELHFGQIQQGSAPPHQIVRLLGPPIAHACVPRPSDAWIRVDQVAEGLDISIDTAGTGTLHGSLGLKGPTGESMIAIDINLVSPPPQAPTSHPSMATHQGVVASAPPAGLPETQPVSPPPSQLPTGSQPPQSDSSLPTPTAEALSHITDLSTNLHPVLSGAMFRANLTRNGVYSPRTGAQLPKWQPWKSGSSGPIDSSASLSKGVVYYGSQDCCLYARDSITGAVLWQFRSGKPIRSSPAIVVDTVYVGSDDGRLYALEVDTGQVRWSYRTRRLIRSSPAVAGGIVCVGSGRHLYALDAATGNLRWRYTTDNWVCSSPAVAGDRVYVGSDDGGLHAIHAATGTPEWRFDTGKPVRSSPAVAGDRVYVGSDDGGLHAIHAATGTPEWRFDTGKPVRSSPAVAGDRVYVGSDDGGLHAIHAATGTPEWRFDTDGRVYSSPAVADGIVYVGSQDHHLYALDAHTGQRLWSFKSNGEVDSSPAADATGVYVGSDDGYLYALGVATREPA